MMTTSMEASVVNGSSSPNVSRILIHPIKSVAGLAVQRARILPGGALEHDREFALFSKNGVILRGKEHPKLHSVEATYDLDRRTVSLAVRGVPSIKGGTFHLEHDRAAIELWFEGYLGLPVSLRRETRTGFPDDRESPGPTIVSVSTLNEVASWFPALAPGETARRFRANLEIDGVLPFWEDRLFGDPGNTIEFHIGDVQFHGVNPCARCAVPPRHPETGDTLPGFQRTFTERRRATLPAWATRSRFDHYYRLTVNTRVPPSEAGKEIRIGDAVEVLPR